MESYPIRGWGVCLIFDPFFRRPTFLPHFSSLAGLSGYPYCLPFVLLAGRHTRVFPSYKGSMYIVKYCNMMSQMGLPEVHFRYDQRHFKTCN